MFSKEGDGFCTRLDALEETPDGRAALDEVGLAHLDELVLLGVFGSLDDLGEVLEVQGRVRSVVEGILLLFFVVLFVAVAIFLVDSDWVTIHVVLDMDVPCHRFHRWIDFLVVLIHLGPLCDLLGALIADGR